MYQSVSLWRTGERPLYKLWSIVFWTSIDKCFIFTEIFFANLSVLCHTKWLHWNWICASAKGLSCHYTGHTAVCRLVMSSTCRKGASSTQYSPPHCKYKYTPWDLRRIYSVHNLFKYKCIPLIICSVRRSSFYCTVLSKSSRKQCHYN